MHRINFFITTSKQMIQWAGESPASCFLRLLRRLISTISSKGNLRLDAGIVRPCFARCNEIVPACRKGWALREPRHNQNRTSVAKALFLAAFSVAPRRRDPQGVARPQNSCAPCGACCNEIVWLAL